MAEISGYPDGGAINNGGLNVEYSHNLTTNWIKSRRQLDGGSPGMVCRCRSPRSSLTRAYNTMADNGSGLACSDVDGVETDKLLSNALLHETRLPSLSSKQNEFVGRSKWAWRKFAYNLGIYRVLQNLWAGSSVDLKGNHLFIDFFKGACNYIPEYNSITCYRNN